MPGDVIHSATLLMMKKSTSDYKITREEQTDHRYNRKNKYKKQDLDFVNVLVYHDTQCKHCTAHTYIRLWCEQRTLRIAVSYCPLAPSSKLPSNRHVGKQEVVEEQEEEKAPWQMFGLVLFKANDQIITLPPVSGALNLRTYTQQIARNGYKYKQQYDNYSLLSHYTVFIAHDRASFLHQGHIM